MPNDLVVRFRSEGANLEIPAHLIAVGPEARHAAEEHARGRLVAASAQAEPGAPSGGPRLLLTGDRDYFVAPAGELPSTVRAALGARVGRFVLAAFAMRTPVRRKLEAVYGLELPSGATRPVSAVDLTDGRPGAAPLWLLPEGRFSSTPDLSGAAVDEPALIAAARWVSSRRSTTFERLFPASAFYPDRPARADRLSADRAPALLAQLGDAIAYAAVNGELATRDPNAAAQIRSAAATVLTHVIATANNDATFRSAADAAARTLLALIDAEHGDTAKPMLRAHVIQLLQLRAPALSETDTNRVRGLVRSLLRESPPYDEIRGAWRFSMCSASEFHEGECDILVTTYRFTEVPAPADAPKAPGYGGYRVFQAPFKSASGDPILLFCRSAMPFNENQEMASTYFHGTLINRHAQLGSYDMRAATASVKQVGYKLMMNSQCAGLTTRFAISRLFPDADIYSSWDSTYFRNPSGSRVVASEGLDCFIATLIGMGARETHAQLEKRIRAVQWYHTQSHIPSFVQFVGPAHPLVVSRYADVNQDGKADLYDGFLDFNLKEIAEDLYASVTPRDPGVAASQIGGEAANGLGWASGSLNRVTQYSDIWSSLPGDAEGLYVFVSGGFHSHKEPPVDVPMGDVKEDLGLSPVVCRYSRSDDTAGLSCEVMFHSHLSHAAKEMKRLLVAAEAMNRAFDLGYLPKEGLMEKPIGRRAALLLTLAGLLEFPADQNYIDGLWAMALKALNFPDISRSVVRGCITEEDHDASNYYGSRRGMKQLIGKGDVAAACDLGKADPAAFDRLQDPDPSIGRACPLKV